MGLGVARVRAPWSRWLCQGLRAGRRSLFLAGMIQRILRGVLALMQLAASDSDTEDARGNMGGWHFRGTHKYSAEYVVSLPLKPTRGREQQDCTSGWRLTEKC